MLIGDSSRFGVDWEINETVNNWIFGRFFLYINGVVVGNQYDLSVDIKGCFMWLNDFLVNPRNRYEPNLYEMDKRQVYIQLASSVLVHEDEQGFVPEPYEDIFARFHISHIGMSSFDKVTLLFMKNEQGMERCVWKTLDGEEMEAYLNIDEVELVFSETVKALADAINHI